MQANAEPSFLNCYICFEGLKKPRMCPSCSKVACEKCLRQWIDDRRSECPHCRKTMTLNNFAECERFISDVRHLLKAMDRNEKVKEKCPQHKIQMTYYCQDCQEPICSDCGMFGMKHRGHPITHLKKIYQGYKNKILNELARFDQKIELYRKNGYQIKLQMQRLVIQIGNKKNFIEEYFLAIIERLEQEFKEKQQKVTEKYQANNKQIEFLESFRENICRQLESSTEKELITKSDELIGYIQSVFDKGIDYEPEEHSFDTIHEIVPKYNQFKYTLKNYDDLDDAIKYSDSYFTNGIQWKLKIYPKGNGVAKQTHLSVFLEMTKGYTSGNKYQYKIQLVNQRNNKDSVIREYNSNFDIGQCWGYNQFIPLEELKNDFLTDQGHLEFCVSVRNPSYRSLVRDQKDYIKFLEQEVKNNPQAAVPKKIQNKTKSLSSQKMNELAQQSKSTKQKMKKFLLGNNNYSDYEENVNMQMQGEEKLPELQRLNPRNRRNIMEESQVQKMQLSLNSHIERDEQQFEELPDRSYFSRRHFDGEQDHE